MSKKEQKIQVKVTEESISLNHGDRELIYWDKAEWIEDPSLTVTIAHCIQVALTNPDSFIRSIDSIHEKLDRIEEKNH